MGRMLHAAHKVSGRLAVSLPFESFFTTLKNCLGAETDLRKPTQLERESRAPRGCTRPRKPLIVCECRLWGVCMLPELAGGCPRVGRRRLAPCRRWRLLSRRVPQSHLNSPMSACVLL